MKLITRRTFRVLSFLAAASFLFAAPAGALVLNLRSGNAPAGNPDPLIRQYALPSTCSLGFGTPFTNADFTAALSSPPAVVLSFVHPAWAQSLPCDPLAAWIGTDPLATPMSVLYALEFNIPDPCCIGNATLNFCWSADDILGDAVNPAGVYLNQVPVLAIQGGNYAAETTVSGVDVTNLVHCGANTLYIYNRDLACAVSGIIFSATLKIDDCLVPAAPASWSNVKARYQ